MKISRNLKTATVVLAAILTTLGTVGSSYAAGDPTQGRIQKRQAQNQAQYHRCAKFALRVYQGGLSQASGKSAKIRAARSHYQANLARCRALL